LVTHFQLPPYEYHWATKQARDIAISATSLGTWFFSKEHLCGQYGTSLRSYPTQNRSGRGRLPTCVLVRLRKSNVQRQLCLNQRSREIHVQCKYKRIYLTRCDILAIPRLLVDRKGCAVYIRSRTLQKDRTLTGPTTA
jgi:hypothetical protein